jgi:hypothetical protein
VGCFALRKVLYKYIICHDSHSTFLCIHDRQECILTIWCSWWKFQVTVFVCGLWDRSAGVRRWKTRRETFSSLKCMHLVSVVSTRSMSSVSWRKSMWEWLKCCPYWHHPCHELSIIVPPIADRTRQHTHQRLPSRWRYALSGNRSYRFADLQGSSGRSRLHEGLIILRVGGNVAQPGTFGGLPRWHG